MKYVLYFYHVSSYAKVENGEYNNDQRNVISYMDTE